MFDARCHEVDLDVDGRKMFYALFFFTDIASPY